MRVKFVVNFGDCEASPDVECGGERETVGWVWGRRRVVVVVVVWFFLDGMRRRWWGGEGRWHVMVLEVMGTYPYSLVR